MEEWRLRCLREKGFQVKSEDGKSIRLSDSSQEVTQRRHYFGLCPVCLKIGEHNGCAGCVLVFYCSKDCQKSDWKNHKVICKTLTKIRGKNIHIFHKNPMIQSQVANALTTSLNRVLTQYESDLLTHPRLCMVCLTGNQAKLKNCDGCNCMAYCSSECRDEDEDLHESVCSDLGNLILDHKIDLQQTSKVGGFIPPENKNYTPLSKLGEMEALAQEYIDCLIPNEEIEFKENQMRKLSWQLSCPATVLHNIEQANIFRLEDKESLEIHIVGARKAEVELSRAWVLFPARLPKLRKLRLVMVGPELEDVAGVNKFFTQEYDCSIEFRLIKKPYHIYERSKMFTEPDIVTALNCGFIFYKEWNESLNSLVRKSGAPLVFTEYYKEDCEQNLAKLEKHCKKDLRVCIETMPNPFASRTAARLPAGFTLRQYGRKNILFSNDFVCVVKSK